MQDRVGVTANNDRVHPFQDRRQGGAELGRRLLRFASPDTVVLALPRGGVPVGYEVAGALDAPLDVFVVRKLGVPGHRELAMGAIASGGTRVINERAVDWYDVPGAVIDQVAREEQVELERRERSYRGGRAALALDNRVVVLIDDGLATGSTMKAAIQAVRVSAPARVVVGVPVGAADACAELASVADEVVCVITPHDFAAVGQWYHDFSQIEDEEVCRLLDLASRRPDYDSRSPPRPR